MRLNSGTYVDKAEVILETAQKRFGLYGVEKTTMREIAADLNMTKGSLYYYFPDKENLYMAVIEKEQSEFMKVLENDLRSINDPAEGIRKYVNNRLLYFKTMINLGRLRAASYSEYQPVIAESMAKFREKEKQVIRQLLDNGNSLGIFRINDTLDTASLFLDLLRGLRSALLNNKQLLVINDEEYAEMTDKAVKFTTIFINGLRNE
jgi:AcrR family transcriptional regulator